jgi:membrane protein DedA with SNARE-associated domain
VIDEDPSEHPTEGPAPLPSGDHNHLPPRWARNAVFGVIGTAIVLGWIGDALWASLVDRNPVVLLLLNAKPRYQLLTVNQIDPWVFYLVVTARLVITKPFVWLVGRWYGPSAMTWAEKRWDRGGRMVRWAERRFGTHGWAIMLITTNNPVCLLAGASGFPLGWFMLIAVVGTLVRLAAVDLVGSALSEPIEGFIDLVVDNRILVVVLSISVVVAGLWWERRRGGSELDEFVLLEQALEQEIANEAAGIAPTGPTIVDITGPDIERRGHPKGRSAAEDASAAEEEPR